MSLRVWLPLNGDLKQQGCSNTSVTASNNITFDNNGKIGKCAYFSGSSSYLTTDYTTNIGTNDFSISLWLKLPIISSGSYFTICTSKTSAAAGVGFGIYWNYSQKKFLWSTADGSGATEIWMATAVDNIVYDQWIHLVMVRNSSDSKVGYFYINGTRYELASVPVIRNIATATNMWLGRTTNGVYYTKMYINDFRIYDHALSAKEVKELSKGLICHYPLNNNAGQENLFNWGNKGNEIITLNNYQNTGSFTQFGNCLTFDAKDTVGTTYTISFWAKSPNGTTSLLLYNSNSNPRYFYFRTTLTSNLSTDWQYFTYTFTNTDRGSSYTYTANRIEIYMPSQMGGQVKLIKIEEGEKATSWSPAPSDTYYNKLGYDKNIIYDTSGYGNDALMWRYDSLGSIESYIDSPRNSLSTYINSENNTTNTASGTVYIYGNCSLTTPNYLTVSFWCKPLGGYNGQTGQGQFCTTSIDIGASAGSDYSTTAMHNRDNCIDMCTSTNIHKAPTISFTKNEWHHYVIVYDGRYGKIYKDTIQTSSCDMGDNLSLASFKAIVIGFSRAGGVWRSNKSYYSDFRLYSTALSEDDIKELYQVGASIDKGNNLYTYELLESGSRELMAIPYTNTYGQHNAIPSNYHKLKNDNGEVCFDKTYNNAGSDYVYINPTNKTYYYDILISVSAGNRFYIGFQRYDKDKTPRSNDATVYVISIKPSSDLVKVRYKGTVNLSTDGVNPCDSISLRVLNNWSDSTEETEGKATVHYLSLREVDNTTGFETTQLFKTGVFKADDFLEKNDKSDIEKTGIINIPNEFIEI